jgi:putative hemolysin
VENLAIQIVLLAILLFFSAVFSSSETALFSLKSYQVRRLQSRPTRRALTVGSLLKDPYHLLVTILIGNTLVNVAASSVGTTVIGRYFEQGVVGISVAVMTLLILIFGEIVPKTFAVSNPPSVSLATAPLIAVAVRVFAPLKVVLEMVISRVIRKGRGQAASGDVHFGEHVAEAIALGHSEGVLDRSEREMLGGIFRLMHLSVQNIMTPRTEVFMLSSDVALGDAVPMVRSAGYSRIPLFDPQKRDDIVGILYSKDLLYRQESPGLRLADVAREPVFVPESKSLMDLLSEFVSGAAHFAVAIDEHGSFAGIVTLDDILSEIIGRDVARNPEKYRYKRLSRHSWEVSGRMEMEYFNVLVGVSILDPGAETIAGLVINRMGRIPSVGDEIVIDNLRIRVLSADNRRIALLRVEKVKK